MKKRFIFLIVLCVIFVGTLLYGFISKKVEAKEQAKENQTLKEYSIKPNFKSTTEKKYYIGNAKVNGEDMYYYTDTNESGNDRINYIPKDSEKVYISENEKPKVTTKDKKSYTLYIPKNSIDDTIDFEVNN